jgi:hypothetical protein
MEQPEAGPDLDIMVAKHVLGERIGHYDSDQGVHYFIESHGLVRDIPPFSTDLAAAWKVVEHLRDAGFLVRVVEHPESERRLEEPRLTWNERQHECLVEQSVRGVRRRANAHANTVPLAICRAALAIIQPRR